MKILDENWFPRIQWIDWKGINRKLNIDLRICNFLRMRLVSNVKNKISFDWLKKVVLKRKWKITPKGFYLVLLFMVNCNDCKQIEDFIKYYSYYELLIIMNTHFQT